ncbi:MAG: MBL fold metallo-hydrolase [Deltaproteobacteria bacterium]|nr:MBL fold metallo-hydrolase [Deltaproteobacteria bacterium]
MGKYTTTEHFKQYSVAPRFIDVLRWRLREKIENDRCEHDYVPNVEVNIKELNGKRDYILWIGHSSLLINIEGIKILVDPVFSNRLLTIKRLNRLNYTIDDIMPINFVLISHNHIDHIETNVLRTLKNSCRYLIPEGLGYYMRWHSVKNFILFNWFESYNEKETEFTFVPAQHWSQRGLFDRNRSLWGGWVIRRGSWTIYYAGDTGYFNIFPRLRKMYGVFDISILPIGAYAPRWFSYKNHMSPYDALKAFVELSSKKMLPVHWGSFRLGQEKCSEPIRRLLALWEKEQIEEERLILLPVGGILSLTSMSKTPIPTASLT